MTYRIDTREKVITNNEKIVRSMEQSNRKVFEEDIVTVTLTGPRAWSLLRVLGNEEVQEILDGIQEALDNMPLYAVLSITKEICGVPHIISFVKEYEETDLTLGSYRICLREL